MNITESHVKKLITPIKDHMWYYKDFENKSRFYNEAEMALPKYLESLGFKVSKMDRTIGFDYIIRHKNYDFSFLCETKLLSNLELITSYKSGMLPIKKFKKFTTSDDKKKYQGIALDLSSQLNNPKGSQYTIFFKTIQKTEETFKLGLLGIMSNQKIIDQTKIDYNLDEFGDKPVGLLQTH